MNDFEKLVESIKELEKTSGTNDKLKILNDLKDVEIAKDFFEKSLSTEYTFGVKKLPDYKKEDEPDRESMYHYVETAYTRLINYKTDIQAYLEQCLTTLREDEYDLFCRICKKDPSCGVAEALVNKVWPGLIDNGVKLCKAVPYTKEAIEKVGYPCYIQRKEDGARCICIIDKFGNVELLSSSGKTYQNLTDLESELAERGKQFLMAMVYHNEPWSAKVVLDGELLLESESGETVERQTGNGVLNKSIKGTITSDEAKKVRFVIWDALRFEEYFGKTKNKIPYDERLEQARRFVNTRPEGLTTKLVSVVKTSVAHSPEEITEAFQEELNAGKEGIIVKQINFIWENKRTPNQVKFKLELDSTLRVTDWIPGQKGTKYENQLGALVCQSSDGKIRVNVGTGFSDEFRSSFPDTFKASEPMFIEVRSNGIISQKDTDGDTEAYSLFLPRMVEVREDKTEADSFETILGLQNAATELK